MTEWQYRRRFHRALRRSAVFTMVTLSLASIAIDASKGTVGWSLVGSIGTVVVLVLDARLSPSGVDPALRLLQSQPQTTSVVTAPVPERATG